MAPDVDSLTGENNPLNYRGSLNIFIHQSAGINFKKSSIQYHIIDVFY